ncbi:disease resistance protein [Pyrus ussuriensis x Pyrus communis]|uniref:Disease resistance protein n=1 Tax=Pyrus ussuriensis x Pyrus communis TaxID=2448454 RepID=A0A5N5I1H1_9ROSA|nr:disease resistance protein [Pyrus ussuriensis x Pyrus communis]
MAVTDFFIGEITTELLKSLFTISHKSCHSRGTQNLSRSAPPHNPRNQVLRLSVFWFMFFDQTRINSSPRVFDLRPHPSLPSPQYEPYLHTFINRVASSHVIYRPTTFIA